ncbi:MAG TPA: toxin, partial [Desulfobacterales bacterium]|nr:toxin [Desulfobacterales bacterium]
MPAISLPKGGGAMRGIGEKFSVNAANGTASISVPIAATPGRSGFGPQLSLSYNSGAGNGPFGLGWNLSIPSITRKTDKGLPRYQDAGNPDIFILSDAEDLVPCLAENYQEPEVTGEDGRIYFIRRYRPRIEGLFARIERRVDKQTGDTHWQSVSKDNITTVYGRSPECRLADPRDKSRVFSWLIEESYDDKGNVIIYEYKKEDRENIDQSLPQEKNRLAGGGFANRYIKRIKYGNKQPYQRDDWLFQVVFDYGDHHPDIPGVDPDRIWACRRDPFSAYRAGFEIRTYRLCRRVLMFHHFAELGDNPCLVRSTDFCYRPDPVVTCLTSVVQAGYVRDENGIYRKKALPPLEFFYTGSKIGEEIRSIEPESLENLPVGLDGAQYQWLDLDSEGISGILTEQAGAWFYKPNLGNGRFAPVQVVSRQPSLTNLNGGLQQIMDLAGDGHKYLVQFSPPLPGYYERTGDGDWDSFTPFQSSPNIAFNDPNLKFIDLTGDGFADILISEDEVFVWYPSRARQGFGPSELVRKLNDEEQGPALVFADSTQSIHLADMSGDGLVDLVRIRNGQVSYWPNLGYGRFGAKVEMDGAPWFDCPDQFNPRRIRLADVDGSGPTDIIYLGRDSITIWFNQ